jgi:hypothetical protein
VFRYICTEFKFVLKCRILLCYFAIGLNSILFQYQNLKQRWLIYQSHFDINLAFGKTPKPPVCHGEGIIYINDDNEILLLTVLSCTP